ncbi:MAG: MMPL family transporter, partial [Thermoplasmata archaeon]|nr:MMPL family transporter [Thermoplasmata archaeon]NIS12698.1 MMPL family transporter [Thermoplasmata archaeon]NIU49700.1 MMPL family transporter [Thermoplasmata archaeon]NIW83201.1 MMPL family transporter [Thermoplasmata archaeon]NIW89427.1 MMPL family transporter [Thermoplasmata archaeon]
MMVLTLVFGAGLSNFSMTMDINDLLPKTEEVEAMKEIQEDFFDTEAASVVTMGEPVLSPTYFREVSDVVEAWATTPKVRDNLVAAPERAIISIPTTLAQYDLMMQGNPDPSVGQLLVQARSYDDAEEIRQLALAYDADENMPHMFKASFWLLFPVDTDHSLTDVPTKGLLFAEVNGSLDADAMTEVLLKMESLAKENTREVSTYMYSDGLLGHYMAEAEAQMEGIFFVLVFIMIAVLWVAFRRMSDTGITMVSLLLAVLWQVGIISWMGYALDLFQFMVPLLLLGLGIDFSLHLIINYREGLAGEDGARERTGRAVQRVFDITVPALVLATLTTMVGFASNMMFDFAAMFKFGLGAAIGIGAVLAVNMFFILPWRVIWDRRSTKQLDKGVINVEHIDARPGPMVRGGYRSLKVAPVLAALLLLIAIPGLVLAPTMKGQYDPRDELIEDQDLSIAATTLMEEFALGTETMYLRVVEDWSDADAWQRMYASLDQLATSELVSKVDGEMVAVWAGPLLPSYAMLDPNLTVLWTAVSSDGVTVSTDASPQDLTLLLDTMYAAFPELSNYVHRVDGTYESMLVTVPTKTNWGEKGLDLRKEVDDTFEPRFETYQATGMALIWGVAFDQLTDMMVRSVIFVVVFAFVFLIALNIYRRGDPILGIMTGIPPILVLGWMYLTMMALGIPLNMMTAMVGAIIIGLGIDYPIHIVNRWVYEADQGNSLRKVYNITMGSTGREIVFSGVTTLLALGSFFLLPM